MYYLTPKLDFVSTLVLGFAIFAFEIEAFSSPPPFQNQPARDSFIGHNARLAGRQTTGPLVVNETAIALEACINRPQDDTATCVPHLEADIATSALTYCQTKYEQINACSIFNNNNAALCGTPQTDYQNCRAYTALVYQYCIENYDYFTDPYLSDCANTQLQVIPSANAPSTTVSGSTSTPGSGIALIPPFSMTPSASTTNPPGTVTESFTPSPSTSNTASCPADNGTVYVDVNGFAYTIRCSTDFPGFDFPARTTADLTSCMQACDAYVPGSDPLLPYPCVEVTFLRNAAVGAGNCFLKYRIIEGTNPPNPAVDSAELVVGMNTLTITLSSTGLPPPVTTLPASTVTGEVTTTGLITYVTTVGTSLVQATTTGVVVSTQYGSVTAPPPAQTTYSSLSTYYTTIVATITSCAPTVPSCPARQTTIVSTGVSMVESCAGGCTGGPRSGTTVTDPATPTATQSVCAVGMRVRSLREDEILAKNWIKQRL